MKGEDCVFVYQYGKVGSTSLSQALKSGVNMHDLYGNVMCPPGFKYRYTLAYKVLFFIDRFIRRFFIKRSSEILMIVPLRRPEERNVSMFFQDLPFWYVSYFSKNPGYAKGEGVGILQEIFSEYFPHYACDAWFDKEFSRFTGIRLEDIEFDTESGLGFSEKGKFKCLFIHHDKVDTDLGRKWIESVTGQDVVIPNVNRGSEKWYADAYKQFMADEDFMKAYREKMSFSKVSRKFYQDKIDVR
ncbi:putative capsular polysaccharide synthesis family protein [Alcanivorax sp. HI0083]|nr:putative capsular polysaccharide synthesis family protein [Alcanivorax sp. HI0083]